MAKALTAFEKYAAKGPKLTDMELPNSNMVRIDSLLDFANFSQWQEWHQIRLWPGIYAQATLWMDIREKGREFHSDSTNMPMNFDIENGIV